MLVDSSEVQGSGLCEGTRCSDVVEVGKNRVEKRIGSARLRELEEEGSNSDLRCWFYDQIP